MVYLFPAWLAGSASALALAAYDCGKARKSFKAEYIWPCVLFSWLGVALWIGETLGRRASGMNAGTAETVQPAQGDGPPARPEGDAHPSPSSSETTHDHR